MFKSSGILGINARNLLYIRPYNKKKAIKLADDKIKTKQFLSARDIPVPKLYGIIRNNEELEKFDFNTLPNAFVLKPNNGYGGEGIIPIVEKKDNHWFSSSGKKLSKEDLKEHINDILDGRFSISNITDTAFFEQLIIPDEIIGKYAYKGLPDIRIVVHNLIPVMAMLRLPTKESDGKANLHLGAVIVGIDIAKGETTHVAYKNRIIDELPDGMGNIKGLKIPHWDEMLLIASKIQLITNLGYLAADICLDKSGPVLLEINARAGLGVQIANLAPLRKRLERIEGIKVTTPTKGVRVAKDMFGNTIEKEIANLSGKEVIHTEEVVEIIQKKGVFRVQAQIDTSRNRSIIDEQTAEKAGMLDDTANYDDEKSTLKMKFSLKNQRIQTVCDVERIPGDKFKIIIGNRDLGNFLIETTQEKKVAKKSKKDAEKEENTHRTVKQSFTSIDQALIQIDNKIKLLYHLRPLNLQKEREKFLNDRNYNPQFEYPQLKFNPIELVHQLNKIETDSSPMGQIFAAKKDEISRKIHLIESIDEPNFSNISIKLFGKPTQNEIDECKKTISQIDFRKNKKDPAVYNSKDAKERFEKVFEKYGLKNWKVKIKENMVADCVAGKNNRLFINENAQFSHERIESLIVHEIETHILTAENGKTQPFELFNRGLANYLITQEGLAMYNVEKQRHIPFSQNYKAMSHVIAIGKALNSSFSETFKYLVDLGIPEKEALRSCIKSKRGFSDTSMPGAFTKDIIYYLGYKQVKKFIESGGDLKDLYIGKMNLEDLETAKSIPNIQNAKIYPEWLA